MRERVADWSRRSWCSQRRVSGGVVVYFCVGGVKVLLLLVVGCGGGIEIGVRK